MEGAVIDLDGTVYRSTDPVPGAREGLSLLRDAGLDVVFVSNTSTKSREACLERLRGMGIEADLGDVLTSASVTAAYVADAHPGAEAFAIGQPALLDELRALGVALPDDPAAADALVAGKDRSFDFDALTGALRALDRGVPFVATNRDRTTPTGDGVEPASGAVVEAIAYAAGRDPDVVAGKPHDPMIEATLDVLDAPPSDCLVVGDNPESDIRMGERAGMATVLVRSGVADRDVGADVEPDHVLESMAALDGVLAVHDG